MLLTSAAENTMHSQNKRGMSTRGRGLSHNAVEGREYRFVPISRGKSANLFKHSGTKDLTAKQSARYVSV